MLLSYSNKSHLESNGCTAFFRNQKDHLSSIINPIQSEEIAIPRIYAELDDQTLAQVEEIAEKKGCSKRQFVLDAIGHYMNYREPDTSEADQLRAILNLAVSERDLARSECDKKIAEIKNLDLEISHRNDALSDARSNIDKLNISLNQLKSEIASIKEEREKLRSENEHSLSIINLKDEEIAFLRGHIKQLSEKIIRALPSEECDKAKKWWKFW